jgi:hypothetical protein
MDSGKSLDTLLYYVLKTTLRPIYLSALIRSESSNAIDGRLCSKQYSISADFVGSAADSARPSTIVSKEYVLFRNSPAPCLPK